MKPPPEVVVQRRPSKAVWKLVVVVQAGEGLDGGQVLRAFEDLQDRRSRKCTYPLQALLLVALSAVTSGADDWVSVVEWAQLKLDRPAVTAPGGMVIIKDLRVDDDRLVRQIVAADLLINGHAQRRRTRCSRSVAAVGARAAAWLSASAAKNVDSVASMRSRRPVILRRESASQCRLHSEHVEEVCRHYRGNRYKLRPASRWSGGRSTSQRRTGVSPGSTRVPSSRWNLVFARSERAVAIREFQCA